MPVVIVEKKASDDIPKKKYYVTMTDRFMSGWGHAKGRTNKFVVGCDTYKQAETIARNAERRSEMKYVNITSSKPYYKGRRFLVSYRNYKDLGKIWKKR